MPEINKERIGAFIAEMRKEKDMTQKELADRLFISAKAISKWETGVSIPSVDMLLPLADILGVNVTEILQGERIEDNAKIDKENVEMLVKKTIELKDVEFQLNNLNRRKSIIAFIISIVIAVLEIAYLVHVGFEKYDITDFVSCLVVGLVLGIYFTFIIKEQLPTFYDEHKINYNTDGIMRMHMPGLYFNNSNWPYISNYIRYWSYTLLILTPIFFFAFDKFIPIQLSGFIFLFLVLVTLLVPIYIIGKKYE